MSHRYRSHCCCGEPEIAQNCFLGYGTPPSTPFNPTKDRCNWENGGVYSNAQGQNIWDNWGYCSHNLDQELILTLERTANMNLNYIGANNFPEGYVPEGCPGNNPSLCPDLIEDCKEYGAKNFPSSSYYTTPNEPMYVRYRRPADNTYQATDGPNWQDNPTGITQRPYIWRQFTLGLASSGWDPSVNGGHVIFPLYTNPNSDDPQNPTYPHGTANPNHCTSDTSPNSPCDDFQCTRVDNYYSYSDVTKCSQTHRGHSHYPLTKTQAQLIGNTNQEGAESWSTSEYGYIPTQGYSQGDPCRSPCPEDGDESPTFPYFNAIREYGSQYFWLQGISDHEQHKTYDLNGEEDNYRLYRNFILWNGRVIEIYRSSYCDVEPYGLWPIHLTLISVMHRETWWEKYWSGFTREGFKQIGNGIPGDDYFVVSETADAYLNGRTPAMIGFGCSGVPIFSWELWHLYKENVVDEEGNQSMASDSDMLQNKIPQSVINAYLAILDDQGVINRSDLEDAAAKCQSDDPQDLRDSHFATFFFCLTYGFAMPYQITDIMEKYNILPKPINHGEEHDYKIFKKKLRFLDVGTIDNTPVGCCINVGEQGIGNCGLNSDERSKLDPEFCAFADSIELDGFCNSADCIHGPCSEAVCEIDPFCCDTEWDSTCVNYAAEFFPDLCFSNSLCVNSTVSECEFFLGGQPNPNGELCPDVPTVSFYPDLQLACKTDNPENILGSCCCFKQSGGFGNKEFLGCITTTEQNCNVNQCPADATQSIFTPFTNCSYNGLACETDGTFQEWNDTINNSDTDGCPTWGNVLSRDFYFYGKPGGWNWYCSGSLSAADIDGDGTIEYIGLGRNTIAFPSRMDGGMNPDCWNAVPIPIESSQDFSDPLQEDRPDCCQKDADDCLPPPLFAVCNGSNLPEIEPNTDDPFEQDGTVITCSNQSATMTCRGIWWQWQLNDWEFDGATEYAGCDTINNAFWLVQNPYTYGPSTTFSLNVNDSGVTYASVDGVENGSTTVVRGTKNRFFVRGILDADESFYSPNFVQEGGENNGVTFESVGLGLILRADNPADNPDTPQYVYTPEVRFVKTDEFEYTFTPFEQLDDLEETKCVDTSYWQIVETFQSEQLFIGDDGIPYRIFIYDRPYLNLYGTVIAEDELDEDYFCDSNRLKYSGIAARIVEYQWYHPPYIRVTGDPALTYICANNSYFCDAPCHERDSIFEWGQCCNQIPWIPDRGALTPWSGGRNSGPSPLAKNTSDEIFPPIPE